MLETPLLEGQRYSGKGSGDRFEMYVHSVHKHVPLYCLYCLMLTDYQNSLITRFSSEFLVKL